MDWSKAKNILIVAFAVTNIILIFVLSQNNIYNMNYSTVDQDFISNVKAELMKKNIIVDTEVPKEISNMAFLTLRYETHDPYNLAKVMMKSGEFAAQDYGNKTFFKNQSEILSVTNKNKIVYGNTDREKIFNKITEKLAKNISESFLKTRGFQDDYRLVDYNVLSGVHKLIYKPVYKGVLIENHEIYMKFEIDQTGIKRFERTWIDVIRLKEKEMSIPTAPDTLLKLLSQSEYYGKDIVDIELCYRFDGDSITTKEEDAYPAWRIKFSDGTMSILK